MDELIAEIESAFAGGVPLPDDTLLHPECMDDVDILDFYGGLRREDMTDEQIVRNYAALTAFSPQAFQYYLPTFMIWTLRNIDTIEYATESTLVALDPGTDKEMLHDFRKSHFTALTAAQRAVIRKFLWRLAEDDDLGEFADNALANYWIDEDPPATPDADR